MRSGSSKLTHEQQLKILKSKNSEALIGRENHLGTLFRGFSQFSDLGQRLPT